MRMVSRFHAAPRSTSTASGAPPNPSLISSHRVRNRSRGVPLGARGSRGRGAGRDDVAARRPDHGRRRAGVLDALHRGRRVPRPARRTADARAVSGCVPPAVVDARGRTDGAADRLHDHVRRHPPRRHRDGRDPHRRPARDGRGDRPVRPLRLAADHAPLVPRRRDPAARRGLCALAQEVARMRERRSSAVVLVLAAATSVQGGAAVAKSLFPTLGPPGVVFLRLLFGSAALWAIARPELRSRPRADLRLVLALGVVLAAMNTSFYESLDRAPLGVAVTVEFLGPLAVAVLGSRRAVDLVWVGLAGGGVALLAD